MVVRITHPVKRLFAVNDQLITDELSVIRGEGAASAAVIHLQVRGAHRPGGGGAGLA